MTSRTNLKCPPIQPLTNAYIWICERQRPIDVESRHAELAKVAHGAVGAVVADAVIQGRVVRAAQSMPVALADCKL